MNSRWQGLPWVAVAGAIGGLAAWFIGASNSGTIGAHWMIDLLAGIFGGALAAAAGVFLLANTDPSQFAKMITFAAFCGLTWRPIIATGVNLVNEATTHKEIAKATQTVDQNLATAVPNTLQIQNLTSATTVLAEKLPSITNLQLRQEAVQTVTRAVYKLQSAAFDKPEAVSALEEIGKQAGASGSSNLRAAAKDSLQTISTSNKASPEIKQKAAMALEALSKPSG
jgi:hypothetical protein